jgi:Ser/Thr protein kinase RdoA (MazF antagonist)
MDQQTLHAIQTAYNWKQPEISPVHSGLINHTLKVQEAGKMYLLQSVNTQVFKHPEQIDANLNLLADYFWEEDPGYLFTAPVKTIYGNSLLEAGGLTYRVFDWIPGSHTIDVVATTGQAFEAAKAFGLFTSLLREFDAENLYISLPDFHNLSLRYNQFEKALLNGNAARISDCSEPIKYLKSQASIVARYEAFIHHAEVKKRVTHHDTKISNVLFDEQDKSLCVIDLDTVMPGYFLSDVGDMFRTYICPVSEEEKDYDKIIIRKEYLKAIEEGYLTHMAGKLSGFEKDHFFYAGEMLIYMQALRFLTDYINNDSYYGSRYEGQNRVRGENQIRLLELFHQAI